MKNSQIILVDEKDRRIGTSEKLTAHLEGYRHRAFSIFLFNSNHEFLLQQRAMGKYHTPGLWTNTCCSHPSPDENIELTAQRRLTEEMGIFADLTYAFHFSYRAQFANGLIENEIDHVFIGTFDGTPEPQTAEVMAWDFRSLADIDNGVSRSPEQFSPWFRKIYTQAYLYYRFLTKSSQVLTCNNQLFTR